MFIPTNGREKNKQQQLSGIMLHVTASKWRGKDDENISPPEKKISGDSLSSRYERQNQKWNFNSLADFKIIFWLTDLTIY